MEKFQDRTIKLIGNENLERIKNQHYIIFGLGGVGGYIFETLIRLGIEKITIVDYDKFHASNLNRQIGSNLENLEKFKVYEYEKRAKLINKNINILSLNEFIDKENIEEIFRKAKIINGEITYIIDAIDVIKSKEELIMYAFKNNIKIVSAMSAGFRLDASKVKIDNILKTKYCTISKKIRKFLMAELKKIENIENKIEKKEKLNHFKKFIKKYNVCFSEEKIKKDKLNKDNIIASISYMPAIFGIMITSYIVNDTIL